METLEELKAENAALEKGASDPPQESKVEIEDEAADVKVEELEKVAEPKEEESSETEVEAWLDGDDKTSLDDIPDAAWATTRRQYKEKAKKLKGESDGEIARLKAENARLKTQAPQSLVKPKRDDFDESDDPESDYIEALTDWKVNKNQAHTDVQRINETQVQRVQGAVDHHYERAEKLANKSKISAEQYQVADFKVRQAIDSLRPGSGDTIADQLIADLGEGSEKVFYNLGVNQVRLSKFTELLKTDPNGIKAGMYLSRLNVELSMRQTRTTNAPKPTSQVNGGSSGSSISGKAFRKKYDEAHKRGDAQAAFDAKMAAKKGGADTRNW